jgi:hypothetical protein
MPCKFASIRPSELIQTVTWKHSVKHKLACRVSDSIFIVTQVRQKLPRGSDKVMLTGQAAAQNLYHCLVAV